MPRATLASSRSGSPSTAARSIASAWPLPATSAASPSWYAVSAAAFVEVGKAPPSDRHLDYESRVVVTADVLLMPPPGVR